MAYQYATDMLPQAELKYKAGLAWSSDTKTANTNVAPYQSKHFLLIIVAISKQAALDCFTRNFKAVFPQDHGMLDMCGDSINSRDVLNHRRWLRLVTKCSSMILSDSDPDDATKNCKLYAYEPKTERRETLADQVDPHMVVYTDALTNIPFELQMSCDMIVFQNNEQQFDMNTDFVDYLRRCTSISWPCSTELTTRYRQEGTKSVTNGVVGISACAHWVAIENRGENRTFFVFQNVWTEFIR